MSVDRPALDRAVAALGERREEWATLPVATRVELLLTLRSRLAASAERWVAVALDAKGLDPDSPLAGEEWSSGPWATLHGINVLIRTLGALAAGRPIPGGPLRVRSDGQVVVRVSPLDPWERLLLSGYSAEVWMRPEVGPDGLRDHQAGAYREPHPTGGATLVLGAGNLASIAPLDLLSKMFGELRVCLLKMNPVNESLGPVFEEIFSPLVERGYLRFAYGGADVGSYLTRHPGIDTVHLTGSAATHDAIVFGPGEEGAERRRRREPSLDKPVTSELGGVAPTVVLPGPWSRADLRFQAEHVATQKLHNSGFNCIACQVLVLPAEWDRAEEFLGLVREELRRAPARPAYYPGAAERQRAVAAAYPQAEPLAAGEAPRTLVTGIDPEAEGQPAFQQEFFAPVLAQTSLPGGSPGEFLDRAVRFCNERLDGTLSANLILHPATARALGDRLEQAVAELRYGIVGVNAWAGLGYLLFQAPWGAFPGHPVHDIESGRGVVHNGLLFDRPQKTVVRGPFRPFPRALLHGDLHLSPKPPWFVTHRRAHLACRRLAEFAADPGLRRLPGIFAAALRG